MALPPLAVNCIAVWHWHRWQEAVLLYGIGTAGSKLYYCVALPPLAVNCIAVWHWHRWQ
jgi:hypothetical protein